MTECYYWSYKSKMIIIKYQEQFYTSKFDSLDKMGKFLEAQNLSRLNYKKINNLHRLPLFRLEKKTAPTPVFLLENPRDGEAWWAAVYGVTELDTTEATQQHHYSGSWIYKQTSPDKGRKSPRQDGFTWVNSTKHLKKKWNNLCQTVWKPEEKTFSNSFHDICITLIFARQEQNTRKL